jgi:multidrug resistance efflux pump
MAMPDHHHEGEAPSASLHDRVQRLRLPAGNSAGPRAFSWLPWGLCGLFALSTLGLAMRPSASAVDDKKLATTATADPIASSGEVVLESKGYIIPAHQIQVSPKVGGLVTELYIEEGKKVKENDTLAVLEKTNYQAMVDSAKARQRGAEERLLELRNGNRPEEIEAAKAALEEAKANREQLYLDWRRNIKLRTDKALPARDYEVAESAYKAMARHVDKLQRDYDLMVKGARDERIRAAEADVLQAQADLRNAEWNLGNCTIKAPVSGTILTKKAEKGNFVNPIAFNIAASLCDMADLSDLEVEMTIQERDIASVRLKQQCRVRSEAFPERIYEGVVSRMMPIADRAKGALPVRIKLLNVPKEEEGVYLKPEMGVIVSFLK